MLTAENREGVPMRLLHSLSKRKLCVTGRGVQLQYPLGWPKTVSDAGGCDLRRGKWNKDARYGLF